MPALVALASAFSLVCSATMVTKTNGQVLDPKPERPTYQVDLDAGRWCVDDCTATFPINSVTESVLTLDRTYAADGAHVVEMNRRTGNYFTIGLMKEWAIESTGKCVAGKFGGFPRNRF